MCVAGPAFTVRGLAYNEGGDRDVDWNVIVLAFSMVFLAELGDKTQLAIFALATQQHPWSVFLGAVGALLISTALAALLASLVAGYLPEGATRVTRWASGALFIAVGVWTIVRPA